MGSIKVQVKTKSGKEYQYFYYRISRRSRIKDGGDGKPVTVDKLIGDEIVIGQYLPFWLWDGLAAVDYAEAMVNFRIKNSPIASYLRWEIEWKFKKGFPTAGKLKFRSTSHNGKTIDARSAYPKSLRQWLQSGINLIIEKQSLIAGEIEAIAYDLARYESEKQDLIQLEAKYKEWKQNPNREWMEGDTLWRYHANYGDQISDRIEAVKANIDYFLESYYSQIATLLEYAPPSCRERFKATIIRQAEKLATSPNYIDRYSSA